MVGRDNMRSALPGVCCLLLGLRGLSGLAMHILVTAFKTIIMLIIITLTAF